MYLRKEYSPAAGRDWGEGEIRRLLRGLQRPHILEAEPLAKALCAAYRIQNPYDAVLRLITQTFVNRGLVGKRLYELIQQCDIDGTATQLAIAGKMNISTRQFFRYRREAVQALALQANNDLQQAPRRGGSMSHLARLLSDVDPASAASVYRLLPHSRSGNVCRIETLLDAGHSITDESLKGCNETERLFSFLAIARALFLRGEREAGIEVLDAVRTSIFDAVIDNRDLIEFEILVAQYVHAVCYLDADAAAELALNIRSGAKNDEALMRRALLIEIEASIRAGALSHAAQSLAVCEAIVLRGQRIRDIGELALREAAIAFMRGDLEAADAALAGAVAALQTRPYDAMRVEALRGRVKLQMGMPWIAPPHLLIHQESSEIVVTPSRSAGLVRSASRPLMFAHLKLRATHLRSMLSSQRSIDEIALERFLVDAQHASYATHEASAFAMLANLHERKGEASAAQSAYVKAWSIYASTRDELLGHDLILFDSSVSRDFGPVCLDDAFLNAFHEIMGQRFASAAPQRLASGALRNAFWRAIIRAAYTRTGESLGRELLRQTRDALAETASEERPKQRAAYIAETARRLCILIPAASRAGFIDRFALGMRAFYEAMDA